MPRPPATCGTEAGYYRHLRTTKTAPCDPCLLAHSNAAADRKRAPRRVPCTTCGRTSQSGTCRSCAAKDRERNRPAPADDIAFHGEWRNVRGIWRAA